MNGQNLTILLTTHYIEEAQSPVWPRSHAEQGTFGRRLIRRRDLLTDWGAYAIDEMTDSGVKIITLTAKKKRLLFFLPGVERWLFEKLRWKMCLWNGWGIA